MPLFSIELVKHVIREIVHAMLQNDFLTLSAGMNESDRRNTARIIVDLQHMVDTLSD